MPHNMRDSSKTGKIGIHDQLSNVYSHIYEVGDLPLELWIISIIISIIEDQFKTGNLEREVQDMFRLLLNFKFFQIRYLNCSSFYTENLHDM